MNQRLKTNILKLDKLLLGWLVRLLYPQYFRRPDYKSFFSILLKYGFLQKIVGFNRRVPWPVHFTSVVLGHKKIKKGHDCDPGDNLGNYIQAFNGIVFGDYVEIGPGVKIISANHSDDDMLVPEPTRPIHIGSHVWIGANAIVLPGVSIGDNVTIGAGSVVTKDVPGNCVAAGNPCRIIRMKQPAASIERVEAR